MTLVLRVALAGGLATLLGCAGGAPAVAAGPTPSRAVPDSAAAAADASRTTAAEPAPLMPPQEAYRRGWMALGATGIPDFLKAHPTYDGRGVLIAILDSGVDPSVGGLGTTTTGDPKVLDLRDFSGEGRVALTPVAPQGDVFVIGGQRLRGAGRLRAFTVGNRYWAGTIAEIPLGDLPASDLNGDQDDTDTLAVVVARASDGWVLFADTDGDGTLEDERPVHDYLVGRQTFGWHSGSRPSPLALAANFTDDAGTPRLDLYFDTSAHGTHVAGIAAGHDMYGVTGFDGVAPGAQVLGLKIANDAQGGISTTGSMLAAMDYAIRLATARRMPLVMNMSFGVGNEVEGTAEIDRLIDSVLAVNPGVAFAISAGNDGPGLSTMGYPGSASRALTVGATFPTTFLGAADRGPDPIAFFSSRGGELAKPDLVTPGVAYSTVPRWDTGDERKMGTSMASPYAAGLLALMYSGLAQSGRTPVAEQVRRALMVTARPVASSSYLDDGTGLPDASRAWSWLGGDRHVPEVAVTAVGTRASAVYRTVSLGQPLDTTFAFALALPAGEAPLPVTFRSSAPWLAAPGPVTLAPGQNLVVLTGRRAALTQPGVWTGVVSAWPADTAAGPVARLVATVIVADTGGTITAKLGPIAAGTTRRAFFEARPHQPFSITVSTREAGEQVLAFLHEPGGQPYREESATGAGAGEEAGVFQLDARDVVPGYYQASIVAPPLDGAAADLLVRQSPLAISAARTPEGIQVTLDNQSPDPVRTEPFVVLVGAERQAPIAGQGSSPPRVRYPLPAWAVHATVDVSMDRAEWPRFTDFGVTLFDAEGRILGKSPLNYAMGRLHVDLPERRGTSTAVQAELGLFPGFADPTPGQSWVTQVSFRLYADSAQVIRLEGDTVTVPPKARRTVTVPWRDPGFEPGTGFAPLGIVVVPEEDHTWTLEVPLPAPEAPLHP